MRFPLFPALLMLLACIAADRVIYKEIAGRKGRGFLSGAYRFTSVILTLLYLAVICMPKRSGSDDGLMFVMWGLFVYLSVYIPKFVFLAFQAVSLIPVIFGRRRLRFMDTAGVVAGVCVFAAMWWGCLVNRGNVEVKRVDVGIAGLPESFDGFTIAQISDLHLGSYGNDTAYVHEVVEKINSLHPDLIVFTGDLVNRRSREVRPFVTALSHLKSDFGVYSILGNHDYGDYYDWDNEEARRQDVKQLCGMMKEMGWTTLHNATEWIHVKDDSVALVGVGNIARPPFHTYGSLEKAYPHVEDGNIKILLSHNPDHWVDVIENRKDANVQLTLSGHTHAMQIEIGGISPAALKYANWGSLGTDSLGRKLYVNKGIGTESMPFRIGATPEITLLTLKAENSD